MSRLKAALVIALAVSVSGCAGLKDRKPAPVVAQPPPAPTPTQVRVEPSSPKPTATAAPIRTCVPRTLAPPPRYPDSDVALRDAPGAADRYQLLAAGRLMRQRRLEELERIVAGCR